MPSRNRRQAVHDSDSDNDVPQVPVRPERPIFYAVDTPNQDTLWDIFGPLFIIFVLTMGGMLFISHLINFGYFR